MERAVSPWERHGEAAPAEDAGTRVHVFAAGEYLSLIAHRYYGDPGLWIDIADYNGIDDPRRVEPGTRLLIPPRRLEDGLFESE